MFHSHAEQLVNVLFYITYCNLPFELMIIVLTYIQGDKN